VRTNYVLIDYENVPVKSLSLLRDDYFRVHVFLGAKNTKLSRELVLAMHALGSRATYVELDTSGQNALDFHLAFYLGQLAQVDPEGFFHVISKDTGFDPLIAHLKTKKMYAARSPSIDDMPCFKPITEAPKPGVNTSPVKRSNAADLEELLIEAIDDLRRRGNAKPRTEKTLLNTLRARFPKETPDSFVDSILRLLIKRKFVVLDGVKVDYALPEKHAG
jgi:PIN domain